MTVLKFRHEVRAHWSPANAAWLVTWGEDLRGAAVLAVFPTEDEVREFVERLNAANGDTGRLRLSEVSFD